MYHLHHRAFLFTLLVIFSFFIQCKDNPTDNKEKMIPSFFMPESNEINGWTRSLDLGDYIEAETTEALVQLLAKDPNQKKIADALITYHFIRGAKQVYDGRIQGAAETLELRIFDQEFSNQAQALFYDKTIKPLNFDFVDTIGHEGRVKVSSSNNDVTLDFYYDKWYVWIFISGRWNAYEAKQLALRFAQNVFDKMLRYYPVDY